MGGRAAADGHPESAMPPNRSCCGKVTTDRTGARDASDATRVSRIVAWAHRVNAVWYCAHLRSFRAGAGRRSRRGRNPRGGRRLARFRSLAMGTLLRCLEARCVTQNSAVSSERGTLDSDRSLTGKTSGLLAWVTFIHTPELSGSFSHPNIRS